MFDGKSLAKSLRLVEGCGECCINWKLRALWAVYLGSFFGFGLANFIQSKGTTTCIDTRYSNNADASKFHTKNVSEHFCKVFGLYLPFDNQNDNDNDDDHSGGRDKRSLDYVKYRYIFFAKQLALLTILSQCQTCIQWLSDSRSCFLYSDDNRRHHHVARLLSMIILTVTMTYATICFNIFTGPRRHASSPDNYRPAQFNFNALPFMPQFETDLFPNQFKCHVPLLPDACWDCVENQSSNSSNRSSSNYEHELMQFQYIAVCYNEFMHFFNFMYLKAYIISETLAIEALVGIFYWIVRIVYNLMQNCELEPNRSESPIEDKNGEMEYSGRCLADLDSQRAEKWLVREREADALLQYDNFLTFADSFSRQ
ncbi:MAG: hypothetical protein MHMPM18_002014 [Marteilia pararefringens]